MRNLSVLVFLIPLLSGLFATTNLFSQDCTCEEYEKIKSGNYSPESIYASTIFLSKKGDAYCRAIAYDQIAQFYMGENKNDSAIMAFQEAEKFYKETSCSNNDLINLYKQWAGLYYNSNDFVQAQQTTIKMLTVAEAAGNVFEQANSYTMIAQLLNQTGQAEKGIQYSRKAALLVSKINDPELQLNLLGKLSKRYLWHYQDTRSKSSLDSSEIFSKLQIDIASKINNTSSIAFAYSNLQGVAWERGDLKTALRFIDSSFVYLNTSDHSLKGTNYFDKADIYIELKNYPIARQMADSCLIYRKISGNPIYIAEAYELLARISKETGNYKEAFEYKELGRAISDSVRNVEKTKQVAELEKKYTQAKNEKTIKELAQQKRIYLLLAFTILLALVGLIFFIRQQTLKNKHKILKAEQRLNRARINPHFFFNTLTSIQSTIMEESESKKAASGIFRLSKIMRETLESTYLEYISIEKETEFLNEYIELQKIRFPGKFEYKITVAPDLDPGEIMIPSMILQPFIENSIEHGFTGIQYTGFIHVNFTKTEKELSILIKDNGKGFSNIKTSSNQHISRASQIIKDRIYLLNKQLKKTKSSFSIVENKESTGVTVSIILPVINKSAVFNS